MADQHHRRATVLGIADQFERTGTHLADGAWRALDLVRMHGLDRIDHHQRRRLHRRQSGQDIAHRCCRGQQQRRLAQPQSPGAQPHLIRRFLTTDIDRAGPGGRHVRRRLQQQRRFADARIAAHQHCRPGDKPAAQCAVKLRQTGFAAWRQFDRMIERDEPHLAPPARQVVARRKHGFRCLFSQRVPLRTIGTLALPAGRDTATGLADIATFGFGHLRCLTRTFGEHKSRCGPRCEFARLEFAQLATAKLFRFV